MFDNIRVVLINTFHPGNIGSVARAMKTMGLNKLCLVDPRDFPAEEAKTLAVGADDILDNAQIFNTLNDAIQDCALIVGTSARTRSFPWPVKDIRSVAPQILAEAQQQQVALVFGRETMGLHNEELQMCNYHVYIPSHPDYRSLNLASAVQIVCYELFLSSLQPSNFKEQITEYSTKSEMDYFFAHLEETLQDINFLVKKHPGNTMLKLKRLFYRARPEKLELNMLRGILKAVQQSTKEK